MKSDLVIIGGGIIGLYSAYVLAQRDINITLIDRSDFGRESSSVAGGILAPLMPWHYNSQVASLTAKASNDYCNLSEHLFAHTEIDIEYWKCGLTIQETCSDEILHWCNQHNILIQQFEQNQINQFHLPEIAQVRMPLVIKALIKYLQEKNITFLSNTSVHSYHVKENRIHAVSTSHGDIHTDNVLLATGAWLPKIQNSNLSITVPKVKPIKGQIIAIQAPSGLLNHIKYKEGHYLIPRKDGLILAGSTLEDVGYNKDLTDSARDTLWNNSLSMLPELNNYSITHHWAGLRPGSAGNIPTIGPHPDIEGLYLNAGHFRYGVAMAPKSADIISQWILDDGRSLTNEDRIYNHTDFT